MLCPILHYYYYFLGGVPSSGVLAEHRMGTRDDADGEESDGEDGWVGGGRRGWRWVEDGWVAVDGGVSGGRVGAFVVRGIRI